MVIVYLYVNQVVKVSLLKEFFFLLFGFFENLNPTS